MEMDNTINLTMGEDDVEALTPEDAMQEMLMDWFETIEEVELSPSELIKLQIVSQMLASLKSEAETLGIQGEDFDEWLRFYVLEQWSDLLDEDAPEKPVTAFYEYISDGQQRLYFHMMKHCTAGLEAESA